MLYKMIVTIVAIVTIAFIAGCDPKTPGTTNGTSDPPPHQPPPPNLDSFEVRTKNYDMLNVQKSKDWLSTNHWTVILHNDSQIKIQRNYKSGNITDRSQVLLGPKGQRGYNVINSTMFTVDDDDNIRVGFSKNQ